MGAFLSIRIGTAGSIVDNEVNDEYYRKKDICVHIFIYMIS